MEARAVSDHYVMHRAASYRELLKVKGAQACPRRELHSYPAESGVRQGPQDDNQASVNTLCQASSPSVLPMSSQLLAVYVPVNTTKAAGPFVCFLL